MTDQAAPRQPAAPRARRDKAQVAGAPGLDYWLIAIVATLLALGLFMVYSASFPTTENSYFFARQLRWVVLSAIACAVIAMLPFRLWRRFAVPLMISTLFVLAAVLALGLVKYGGRRFLGDGSVQPSEFAKLTVTVYVATWLTGRTNKVSNLSEGLLPFLMIVGAVAGLVAAQHSFSVTIIILTISLVIFFLAGGSVRQIGAVLVIGGLLLVAGMALAEYPLARVKDWYAVHFNPSAISPDMWRILNLLRSGGAIGTDPISFQTKANMPALWSDFLFANVAHDLGIIGTLLVVFLYLAFIWRGLTIAASTKDSFAALTAAGLTTWIAVQAMIHIGTSLVLIPTTGQPLPFMSYGGSSLLASMMAIGLLLSISRSEKEKTDIYAYLSFRRRDGRPRVSDSRRGQRIETGARCHGQRSYASTVRRGDAASRAEDRQHTHSRR